MAIALAGGLILPAGALAAEGRAAEGRAAESKSAESKPAESEPAKTNPFALGQWDEGARDPAELRAEHAVRPYDPRAWRVTIGLLGGGTAFDYDLDLGGGNYDARLAPAGASSWGARIGLDLGSLATLSIHGTYTSTTYFEGGSPAHILTAAAELFARARGWPHTRMEAFAGAGGGVMRLANSPDYISSDTDGLARLAAGVRWVGDWLIPRLEGALLIGDGLDVGSTSMSWQVTLSLSVPVLTW